ncbi:MAG: alpha/beta hydrolase [Pseudomonadota bacterium]
MRKQFWLIILISLLVQLGARPLLADVPEFGWHDKTYVPFQASKVDPRFAYLMYVPEDYDENEERLYPLLVLMHGTERAPHHYIMLNAEFAETYDVILMAPLFPVGTHGGLDLENYKFLDYEDTRYDLMLLSMIDEVSAKYRIDGNRFSLFGFSGGGHFSHRFFYLHPHRLNALSIGAPGVVTLIDNNSDWWVGTRDIYWRFNVRMDLADMRRVPVHMVIGAQDLESWGDKIPKASPYYMGENVPGASFHAAGKNRQERLAKLRDNFEAHEISVQFEVVPGVGHEHAGMFPAMQRFFIDKLSLEQRAK